MGKLPLDRINHTSWKAVDVVTPTDRSKSVSNCCVIEVLVALCVVALGVFLFSVDMGVFIGLGLVSSFSLCNV